MDFLFARNHADPVVLPCGFAGKVVSGFPSANAFEELTNDGADFHRR